jgi:uncharacterized coiled-coil DUF342 family protein
LYQAQE